MFRIGLCDEDTSSIHASKEIIEKFLTEKKTAFKIYEFVNRSELFLYLKNEIYDLDILFLDIIIGEDSGLDIAKTLAVMHCKTSIIFLTNNMEYCSRVYAVEHVFFVLKKDLEEYMTTISKKWIHHKYNIRKNMVIRVKGRKIILVPLDILYLERYKRSTQVACITETVRTSSSLDDLYQQLEKPCFVHCHNSYIVNLTYVKEYSRNELILCNGHKLPISRKYSNEVRKAFARWLGEPL